jgi:hypothetical protein
MDRSSTALIKKLTAFETVKPTPFDDRTYTPRALLLCSLPYRKPKTENWIRTAGRYTLKILPDADHAIPYGSYPRLFNYWLTNEVKRTKQKTLTIGGSYETFLYAIGIKDGGKQRRNFMKQAHNFLTATITFTERTSNGQIVDWMRAAISKRYRLFWDVTEPREDTLFKTEISLTEEYYEEVMNHAVPLNLKMIDALKRSPLALDLYGWMNYKFYAMAHQRIPHQTITWSLLNSQFGGQFARLRDFKVNSELCLRTIQYLWPQAKFKITSNSLTLLPSSTSVAPKFLRLLP